MGGASLPTANTPGYTTFRGRVTCDCLAAWLPVYERLLKARGLIKSSIDVWQLTGGAPASGGTHTQGGAYDLLYQTSPAHIAVAREMGAGAWGRTVAQGFTAAHQHGVLYGCPHNAPALYQYTAMRRGYNGLGKATTGPYAGQWGYGHKDEYPDPSAWRTWRQGIAWAEAELARLNQPKAPAAPARTPAPAAPQEIDMQPTDKVTYKNAITGQNETADVRTLLARAGYTYTGLGWEGSQIDKRFDAAERAAATAAGKVAALEEAFRQFASGSPIDLSVLDAKIAAAVDAAVADLRVTRPEPPTQ